jgi:hypothetical protein
MTMLKAFGVAATLTLLSLAMMPGASLFTGGW